MYACTFISVGTSAYDYHLLSEQQLRLHGVHDYGSDYRQSVPGLRQMNATVLYGLHFTALRLFAV